MDIPIHLLDGLNSAQADVVRAWWSELPEANQSELCALCDRSRESCFFDSPDEHVPEVIGGQFVADEDTRGWSVWRAELFDYLVCHPEFAEPQVVRIFHIGCAQHIVSNGVREHVTAQLDLDCPFGLATCPIKSLKSGRVLP